MKAPGAAFSTSSPWVSAVEEAAMRRAVGTGLADDPQLTVRDDHGRPSPHQVLRAVMGERDLPTCARVLDDAAPAVHLRTRDPQQALAALFDRGQRHVFLEGGPQLAAAFQRAGSVDEIVAHLAPVLLGAGSSAVGDLGVTGIVRALRPVVPDITIPDSPGDQPNVRLTLTTTDRS